MESSSESELDSFNKKLRDRWQCEQNMNLKTSLGIDSSGDSEVEVEVDKGKKKTNALNKESSKDKIKRKNEQDSKKVINENNDEENSKNYVKNKPSNSELHINKEKDRKERDKKVTNIEESNKKVEKNKKRDKKVTNTEERNKKVEKNREIRKKEIKNVLTSDDDSEHEGVHQNQTVQNNLKKKDNITKSKQNKTYDKMDEHKKDRHSAENEDKKSKVKENKNKILGNEVDKNKNKEGEMKKMSKKESQSGKNTLTSDDSESEDIKKDCNDKTNKGDTNKNDSLTTNRNKKSEDRVKKHKNEKSSSEGEKIKDDKNSKFKDNKNRSHVDEVEKTSKGSTNKNDGLTTIKNKKSEDRVKKYKNEKSSSENEEIKDDKNSKFKENKNRSHVDEVKKKINKKGASEKITKKETQDRKNTLTSSDDSENECNKKDFKDKNNPSKRHKEDDITTNRKNETANRMKELKNYTSSSESEDVEKGKESEVKEGEKKSHINETAESIVNKEDKYEVQSEEDRKSDIDDTNEILENFNENVDAEKHNEESDDENLTREKTTTNSHKMDQDENPKFKVDTDSDNSNFTKGNTLSDKDNVLEVHEAEDENCEGSSKESKAVGDNKTKQKCLKRRSERNESRPKNPVFLDSSDEEDVEAEQAASQTKENSDSEEKDEMKDDVQEDERSASPINLSSANSSDSEVIIKRKRKPKSSSDSDFLGASEDESKTNVKKRKRIKMADSSDDDMGSDEDNVKVRKRKSSVGESPGKGGRKNIKKIKGKDDLADATKEAAEEEKERRRRVEERQKLFKEVFEVQEAHVLEKLVLDFDPKEKRELLSVDKNLVSKMKPHQAKGVKFMWDSCFESLNEVKKKKGSGCILAHCMGLGKTFQVISLVHTLLSNTEETGVHTIMVVCPLSTVLNWYSEFDKWLQDVEGGNDIEVYHLTKCKQNPERARELRRWQRNGGVLIMGYEMFRNLTAETNKKFRAKMKKDFQETLIDPGADLIVCDEGHMLKNEQTALSKAMTRVRTLRRIVLTGTPMQNNLNEYHCMVQFVKPNLLGTRKEFLNRFVNPITNGQFVDSTDSDVKVMKRRAHVLHTMLEGLVQRFDYNVLTPFLPPKHEYVVSVCLSELQIKLYQHYLHHYSQQSENNKGGARLFQDWQALGRIWTHPRVLKLSSDKANWLKEKKAMEESDSEGSIRDFIDDGSDAETTPDESDDSSFASDKSVDNKKNNKNHSRGRVSTRSTRSNRNIALLDSSEDEKEAKEQELAEGSCNDAEWWSEFIEPKHLEDINHSGKLVLLFGILKECEMIEDKILVFSQSLFSLDLIEYFLDKIDAATQEGRLDETLGNHQGNWSKGLDYFRLDGSTSSENRSIWCSSFNREDNPRARLFLISTRAGGLGINLTAANRVIIFDASWNPSHDVQSIFRIYRFGQKKPCYVYRFIAHGTMEEKVYDRQVAKQSMSNRVVDEQQVHRHFSSNDLNELYSFTPPTKKEDRKIPALPKDVLFAEILQQFSDWVEKYHEHDSLLENVIEEGLNEEERKLAWEDYENDKKRGFVPATTNTGTFNPMSYQIEYLRQQLKAQYPQKSEQELNQILVYQVSILMRQQQMKTQMQQQPGMGMAGNVGMVMPQGSMMPFGQQMLQRPTQQQATQQTLLSDYQQQLQKANLARLQLQQMQFQQQQSVLRSQLTQQQQSAVPGISPAAFDMMLQKYQGPKAKKPQETPQAKPSKPSS